LRSARGFAASLLATAFLAASGSGQTPSPTGNVYGTALDADGDYVSGVTVTLTGPGAVRTAATDRRGDFHFLDLSPGEYSVALEGKGFQTVRRDVTVVLGGNAVLAIGLSVAGVAEGVTVDASSLDSRKIETGATFDGKELLAIPTTRDPWAFVRQVPGVVVAAVVVERNSGRPAFVGKGSRPDQNNFNLDGVAISVGGRTPLLFDFDSFESIEVATGGSDLSLATPGVTVNLVTKRGTNQFRSSAHALYTGGNGWDYGVEAGGPVWRDRVWLWGSFARDDYLSSTRHLGPDESITNRETLRYWNAKLNAELAKANTLTLSHNNVYRTRTVDGEPSSALDGSTENVRPAKSFRVQDSQVLSAAFFLSGYASYVTASTTDTPLGGVEEQADQDEFEIWRHSNLIRQVSQDEGQAGLNASAFFPTGKLGHELKFGFGYRDVRFGDAESWPGDQLVGHGQFTFDDGTHVADVTRAQNPKSRLNLYDAFVGDTITAGNLTVNAGVRFDYQQGKNLPSDVAANPVFPELLPAVQYGGDAGYPITWRLLQPRVGATYALDDHLTLLRASYSRFVDSLDSNTIFALNPFPEIATLQYFWTDANGNGRVEKEEIDLSSGPDDLPGPFYWFGVDKDNPGSSVQVNRLAKGFKPPSTDELILGVERQIAPDLSGSLAYTYRIIHNLAFSPLIGTTRESYQYFGNATGTVTADPSDPSRGGLTLDFDVPYYGLISCPDPCAGTELQNRPDAHETYNGVEVQLIKSYSHGWMARVSLAYNDWQQHIGAGAIVNPNNVSPGVNSSGLAVAGAINAHWQFNVSGSVELPLGVSAGLNFYGRQGFPIPYFVDVQTNDSGFNVYGLQVGKLEDHRLSNVYQLDLQLARAFQFGASVTVIPQFACFNVLDSHTVLDRNGRMGRYDTLLTPTFDPDPYFNGMFEEMRPRVFRGGLRVTF
jgi:hypothetical protein